MVNYHGQLRIDAQFWLAVTLHAQTNPTVAALLSAQHRSIIDALGALVRAQNRRRRLVPHADPHHWAMRLAALSHGLALSLLMGVATPEFAHDELTTVIDQACGRVPALD